MGKICKLQEKKITKVLIVSLITPIDKSWASTWGLFIRNSKILVSSSFSL